MMISIGLTGLAGLLGGCIAVGSPQEVAKSIVNPLGNSGAVTEKYGYHNNQWSKLWVKDDGTLWKAEPYYGADHPEPGKERKQDSPIAQKRTIEVDPAVKSERDKLIGGTFADDKGVYMGKIIGFVDTQSDESKYSFFWRPPNSNKPGIGLSPVAEEDFYTFVWHDYNKDGIINPGVEDMDRRNHFGIDEKFNVSGRIGAVASGREYKFLLFDMNNNIVGESNQKKVGSNGGFMGVSWGVSEVGTVGDVRRIKLTIDGKEYINREITITK